MSPMLLARFGLGKVRERSSYSTNPGDLELAGSNALFESIIIEGGGTGQSGRYIVDSKCNRANRRAMDFPM
jgi:hypothetical protein